MTNIPSSISLLSKSRFRFLFFFASSPALHSKFMSTKIDVELTTVDLLGSNDDLEEDGGTDPPGSEGSRALTDAICVGSSGSSKGVTGDWPKLHGRKWTEVGSCP